MYSSAIKYGFPVVVFIIYTLGVYRYGVGQERDAWEKKLADAEIAHKNQIIETERRWAVKLSEVDNRGTQQINELANDIVAVANERDRLQQLYKNTPKRCPQNSTNASSSQAASPVIDLHSQLYAESIERNEKLAAEADRYRIAGEACERWVNGLTNPN